MTDHVEEAAARVGSVLDERWTIESLLGIGGMAAVYSATDGKDRRAIKVLHPDVGRSQDALDRFRREERSCVRRCTPPCRASTRTE